jgi:hypothetical protein
MITTDIQLRNAPPLRRYVQRLSTLETLTGYDDVFRALRRLEPIDAEPIAKALLAALLRLAWSKVADKPGARPEAVAVPLKLYNRKAITKHTLDRLRKATGPKADAPLVLEACRMLLVGLAAAGGSIDE